MDIRALEVKVGDRVLFGKYSGTEVEEKGAAGGHSHGGGLGGGDF